MIGTAQPYLDIANVRYQFSPTKGGSTPEKIKNTFQYINFSFNLPIQFKKDSSILVFSPYTDRWKISIDDETMGAVHSIALPLTYIKRIDERWTAALTAIVRWNSQQSKLARTNLQAGGAMLFTYKKQRNLSYKAGLYYNNEFFGHFVVPLVGVDWRIDRKNNLFGVLPGNLTYEHKLNGRLYVGGVFRAITNSYKIENVTPIPNPYIRIEENHVGAFGDFYLSKGLVLNAEIAHSVLRRFRMGYQHGDPKYYFSKNIQDNVVFKIACAYRVRFAETP